MRFRVLWRDVPRRFVVIAERCEAAGSDALASWAEWVTDGHASNPGDLPTAIRVALRSRPVRRDARLVRALHALLRWELRQVFRATGRRRR